jgi:integrase
MSGVRCLPREEWRLLTFSMQSDSPNVSPIIATFVRIALMTGMRSGEITTLTWGQVDLASRVITVGKAKTSSGTGRQIPLNEDLSKFCVLTPNGS